MQFPLLKPAIVIAVIIRSMEALKMFDPVVLLTFGGPGTSTQTVAYFLWEQVWVFNKFSFGAAASILLLLMFSVLDLPRHLPADPAAQRRRREAGMTAAAPTMSPEQARARRLRRERRNADRAARHPAGLDRLHRVPDLLDGVDLVQGLGRMGDLAAALAAARADAAQLRADLRVQRAWTPRSAGRRPSRRSRSGRALGDAVLVCTTAALLALLLGTFLAYSISRFNVGGKYFRHTILTIRMIPPIVVAISILIYYAILIPYATSALFGMRISLFDTYIGLILIYTVTTLPFVIWMMLTFIDEVPYTLEHAARLMGAGRITVIRRVVLPLVASGMVVTFLFVFILNWAEFLLALTLTHPEVTTLTVLLNKFQSASEGRLYGPQAAIGTMITIPVVILGILIQKHLVKGFSFGTIRK